jgi:hypothetical protein
MEKELLEMAGQWKKTALEMLQKRTGEQIGVRESNAVGVRGDAGIQTENV